MEKTFSVRRFAYAVAAFVAILTVATVVSRVEVRWPAPQWRPCSKVPALVVLWPAQT